MAAGAAARWKTRGAVLSQVGHVEFDPLPKEWMVLQLIPAINNAKIAAGHVLCASKGMQRAKWLLHWLSSSGSFRHPVAKLGTARVI